MRVRFLKPSYFVWLFLLGVAYAAAQIGGLPHLRLSYQFRSAGNTYDPFAQRYYTRCTYWGPNGTFTIQFPKNGECAVFRFFTSRSEFAEG